MPEAAEAAATQSHRSGPRDWWTLLPNWLQAVSAMAAVLVSVGALLITGDQLRRGTGSESDAPVVNVTTLSAAPEGLAIAGSYQHLRPAIQTLFIIAKPVDDAEGDWIPVQAKLRPTVTAEGGVEDGEWDASMPLPDGAKYRVAPVILDGGFASGALSGALDDLKVRGSKADGVVASGPEMVGP